MAIAPLPAHVLVEHIRNHQPRMALDVLSRFGFDAGGAMIKNLARYGTWDSTWAPAMAAAWARSDRNESHAMDALMALMARSGNWNTMAPMADWLLERISPTALTRRTPVHHAAFHGQIEAMPALLKRMTGTDDPKSYDWNKPLNGHSDTPLSLALESGDIDTITGVRIWGGPASEQIRITLPAPRVLSVDVYAGQRGKKPAEVAQAWTVGRDRAALLSRMDIENWDDLFRHMGIGSRNEKANAGASGEAPRAARRL